MICGLCQLSWCKYSHHGKFQVINSIVNTKLRRGVHSQTEIQAGSRTALIMIKSLVKIFPFVE